MERQTGIPIGQPYSTVLISPPIIRLSSLSRSFSHSLTGSVPEAVLKNLAGRIFSESFIHMLYHIWYNMSSSMLHMNVTIELYCLHETSVQKKPLLLMLQCAYISCRFLAH